MFNFFSFISKNQPFLIIVASLILTLSIRVESQVIYLTTEHYPPYNIDLSLNRENRTQEIGGASTEIVKELMQRSKYSYSLKLLPWKRAYQSAQNEVYTGVFSTTRTPAREELFKWVGPIADNNYILFTSKDRDISISSIEEAKNYTVGAYGGSVAVSIMADVGITTELVPKDYLNILKLERERIDLWISGSLYGPYLAKQNGVSQLKEVFTVRKTQMYIAFNKETPDSIIQDLNTILESMRKEGFMEGVYSRYQ